MKKYILFISLYCFAFIQAGAMNISTPQDSIPVFNGKMNYGDIEMAFDDFSFQMDTNAFSAFKDLNFSRMDSSTLAAMKNMKINDVDLSHLKESLKASRKQLWESFRNLREFNWDDAKAYNFNQSNKSPKKVETKTFSDISEIKLSQQYGNIIVKESKSKQVELEIQYYDTRNQQNLVNISTNNKVLSISSKGSFIFQVDFIINIPRNTALSVDLKYGKIKMDAFHGQFTANLSYSSLNAESFFGFKPVIKDKYGKVNINSVQDLDISSSYSKIMVDKADNVGFTGKYGYYTFNKVQTLSIKGSTSGNFKIGSINDMTGGLQYADITIDNLNSSIITTCDYSDIQINSISSKANVDVKGRYSDISLGIPNNVGASFDVSLKSGNLDIGKMYKVNYTEQSEIKNQKVKKGQIGSKKPTATITISNTYANVKFQ